MLYDGRWRALRCRVTDEMPRLAVVVTQGAAVVGWNFVAPLGYTAGGLRGRWRDQQPGCLVVVCSIMLQRWWW